ncbi:MAG: hypothetical protein U9N43_04095 [Euryarchaeota archaeon]|nr:hypothetical protein [Euryarchaeota archaeon]
MAKNALECEMYAGCLFHCQQGLERDASRQKPVRMAREALVAHTAGLVQGMTASRELSALLNGESSKDMGVPGAAQYTC